MEFFFFASLEVTLDTHFSVEISRLVKKSKFVFLDEFLYRMHDYKKKKMTFRACKSGKKTFKYNLDIILLKNLILLSMLFLKKAV